MRAASSRLFIQLFCHIGEGRVDSALGLGLGFDQELKHWQEGAKQRKLNVYGSGYDGPWHLMHQEGAGF